MARNVNFNNAPLAPGVYFFKDQNGRLLYIGKAAHLRTRIRSHFQSGHKDAAFYDKVAHIEWRETDSEIEALILEALLIKKHRPPYNVVLRDDKNYFFVGFTKETYPKVFTTHRPIADAQSQKSKVKSGKIEDFIAGAPERVRAGDGQNAGKDSFPAPSVARSERSEREPRVENERVNYNSKLKTHIGPFTSGRALRETLRLLQKVFPYCTCTQLHKRPCMRFHLERCLGICCIRPDRLENYKALFIGPNRAVENVKREYRRNIKNLKEILQGRAPRLLKSLNREMAEASRKQDFERAAKIRDQAESFKWVLAHAHVLENAYLMSGNAERENGTTALKELLALPEAPRRIESYDISNIQGNFAVGSMVVFESGAPKKSDYRKFRIRTVEGANDVAMLKEVFSRRLKHPEWPLPDVVIVDGGLAQVNALNQTLSKLYDDPTQKEEIKLAIIGFTKGPQHKGTRLTLPDKRTILFKELPDPLKNLLTHIDNEAHRFAIQYYRKLHRKGVQDKK
jgi:excinuclease ABC subunit C